MTHDEARELIGAVPGETSPELLEHLKTCPECQAYRDEMLAFDAKLRRALELDWQKIQGGARPAGPMPKPPVAKGQAPGESAAPGEVSTEPGARATVTLLKAKDRAQRGEAHAVRDCLHSQQVWQRRWWSAVFCG